MVERLLASISSQEWNFSAEEELRMKNEWSRNGGKQWWCVGSDDDDYRWIYFLPLLLPAIKTENL